MPHKNRKESYRCNDKLDTYCDCVDNPTHYFTKKEGNNNVRGRNVQLHTCEHFFITYLDCMKKLMEPR